MAAHGPAKDEPGGQDHSLLERALGSLHSLHWHLAATAELDGYPIVSHGPWPWPQNTCLQASHVIPPANADQRENV